MRFHKEFPYAGIKEVHKLDFDGTNRRRWGGDDEPEPTAPTAPTYTATIQDYISNYPALHNLLQTYAPQEASLFKDINEQLYPQTAGLQENLATQATEGMSTTAPEFYQQSTRDALKSQFGRNLVYNPQAQEQYGLATQQANEDWKRYYQNMGLTLAGRQPLASYSNNITSQYAPAQASQYASNVYGNQVAAYGTQSQNYRQGQQNPWLNMAGSLAGGIGGGLGTVGGMATYGYGSNKGWW